MPLRLNLMESQKLKAKKFNKDKPLFELKICQILNSLKPKEKNNISNNHNLSLKLEKN